MSRGEREGGKHKHKQKRQGSTAGRLWNSMIHGIRWGIVVHAVRHPSRSASSLRPPLFLFLRSSAPSLPPQPPVQRRVFISEQNAKISASTVFSWQGAATHAGQLAGRGHPRRMREPSRGRLASVHLVILVRAKKVDVRPPLVEVSCLVTRGCAHTLMYTFWPVCVSGVCACVCVFSCV